MLRIVYAVALIGVANLIFQNEYTYAQSYPTWPPTWGGMKDYAKGVIRAEGEGFRSNDQANLPNPPTNIGSSVSKEEAYYWMALSLYCRKFKDKRRGTADPLPAPTSEELKNADVKHSWDTAGAAADRAEADWGAFDDSDKEFICTRLGSTHFWHECYEKNGTTFTPSTPWPNAAWVDQLKKNAGNYMCIPSGNNYFYVPVGKYCKECLPLVKVK